MKVSAMFVRLSFGLLVVSFMASCNRPTGSLPIATKNNATRQTGISGFASAGLPESKSGQLTKEDSGSVAAESHANSASGLKTDGRPEPNSATSDSDQPVTALAESARLIDGINLNVGKYDWPQWGGSTSRMNTPSGKNIPIDWDIGDYSYNYQGTHPRTGRVPNGSRNIKWVVPLGSQTYGNPVVANGRIFIGTNNGARYLGRFAGDLGVLLCFEEKTGRFLWQHSNHKLATGRVNDWPEQGVCSTPVVDGNRLWYVSNRGEVVCLDTEGFYDNEDDGAPWHDDDLGEWVPLVEVPAALRKDVPRLRDAFADAGTKLDRRLRLRKIGNRLTLARYVRNSTTRRYEWIPSYELRIENEDLHAFELSGGQERKPVREVFSAKDDLFPALRENQLDDRLRDLMTDFGSRVPDDTSLTVIQEGRRWELQCELNGQSRVLRISLSDGMLSVSKQLMAKEQDEADVVWKLDMINELSVFPHNMSTCSMLTVDETLFVCTSNGVDEAHLNIPSPRSPSFMALDRQTGKILWEDNSPFDHILHAQWASPSYGVFKGQPQVIFPGGDGWLYSFDPKGDGNGKSRLLWKFDVNPKESKWELGGRGTRNSIIAFPAIYDGLVYIAVGQDPEHGEGEGHLWCIDPAVNMDGGDVSAQLVVDKDGNVLTERINPARGLGRDEHAVRNPHSAVRWHFTHEDINGNGEIDGDEEFHRSLTTPLIKDDILYIADLTGYFHCLDAKTGKSHWNYDTFAACWGSPVLVDGHVYLGDEDGDMHIFKHSADPRVAFLKSNQPDWGEGRILTFDSSIYGTPIVANDVLYVGTRSSLFAIEDDTDADSKLE